MSTALMHVPKSHVCVVAQTEQVAPPVPHAPSPDPPWHSPPAQQPLHDDGSHAQLPPTQCRPLPQEPAAHVPPHPSLAPHALPVQSGTQTQEPWVQLQPLGQTAHATPPVPQAPALFPSSQPLPPQQPPAQDVASHWHAPATHRSPAGQLPLVQIALQPSL
jgi:hypothetical protein